MSNPRFIEKSYGEWETLAESAYRSGRKELASQIRTTIRDFGEGEPDNIDIYLEPEDADWIEAR